ncbi:MAG: hypothetical protein VSS52_011495 [Thiotrichaceae bacterium]|nr:hypothetical protein [Thiotrichaceae bacterium]
MEGDIVAIQDDATQLQEQNPSLTVFTTHIISLAKNFDDELICELLAPHL